MNVFQRFVDRAPNRVFMAIVTGAAAGVCYALMIPLMLQVLRPEDGRFDTQSADPTLLFGLEVSNAEFAAMFAGICLFVLAARTFSQVVLARVAMSVAADLRISMYRRIAAAPIAALERIGPSKLIATLTTDVPRIVAGARLLPDVLTNSVTLIGMLAFLYFLNDAVFWFVLGCIGVGSVVYQVPVILSRRFFTKSRLHIDDLQEAIRGLLYGAKELKLSNKKRYQYLTDVLEKTEQDLLSSDKWGQTIVRVASNYGNMLSFFVIGAVSFIFVNYHAISNAELIGVVMALLYVSGPVLMLMNVVPQLTISQVSVRQVEQVMDSIPEEAPPVMEHAADNWQSMEFSNVTYQYAAQKATRPFTLGPVSLRINRGEVLFLVGGNGSGKSTLGKLLSLHYQPTGGEVRYDNTVVDEGNINAFRQHTAAIYSDYYLFEQLLGVDKVRGWGEVERYLDLFDLRKRISFENGRFSSQKLSDGQRRRLALLVALMDNKSFYLFDEWAADQDPTFKAVFYNELLPKLRARGKAVVVISHDDRYFAQADRLVVLEEGRIIHDGDASDYDPMQTVREREPLIAQVSSFG